MISIGEAINSTSQQSETVFQFEMWQSVLMNPKAQDDFSVDHLHLGKLLKYELKYRHYRYYENIDFTRLARTPLV